MAGGICVLGPVHVVRDEGPVALTRMQRRLLAALVVADGRTCDIDELVEALWERSPPSAAKLVQVYVSQLRKLLPLDITIHTRTGAYALETEPEAVDARRFERLVRESGEARGQGNAALAASLAEQALALWGGRAFGELVYEDFARADSERLEGLRLDALDQKLDALLALGRHADALGDVIAFADEQPLRERAHELAMLALYRCGRQTEALERFTDFRRRLDEELGLEPSEKLRDLQRRILQQDPELDLRPERASPIAALPLPPNLLVGRDGEVRDLRSLLERRAAQLIVLTGAGGTGKTRLALEVARQVTGSFANGAVLVELAPLRDPDLVLPTIAHAVGVADDPDEPLEETLSRSLAPQELLLVVDNAEHVRAAAPALARLVSKAARLNLLVTSRAVLHLSGEYVFPVAPLADGDAVELFTQRARSLEPAFRRSAENDRELHEICQRVDCLPLAIELAAARIRTLTPRMLQSRLEERLGLLTVGLRDLPARQHTLRESIAWSVDLLDEHARQVFARLAVFPGGATLDAAEAVCGADPDTLGALVDDHLVRRDDAQREARFAMLETIREYALELLGDEREAVEGALVEWLAEVVEQTDFRGADLDEILARFDAEIDNVRAGLDAALRSGSGQDALRIAGGLLRFWFSRGLNAEGRAHIEAALVRAGPEPTRPRALALHAGGGLAYTMGDYARAKELAAEGVAVAVEIGSLEDEAWAHNVLGIVARAEGDFGAARAHLSRAASLQEELGIEPIVARLNLASATLNEGDAAAAVPLFESVLEYFLRLGELGEGQGLAQLNLGQARYRLAEYDRAGAHFEEAHRSFVTIGFRAHAGHALHGVAAVEAARGRYELAAELLGRACSHLEDIAWSAEDLDPDLARTAEASARGALGDERFERAFAAGRGGGEA